MDMDNVRREPRQLARQHPFYVLVIELIPVVHVGHRIGEADNGDAPVALKLGCRREGTVGDGTGIDAYIMTRTRLTGGNLHHVEFAAGDGFGREMMHDVGDFHRWPLIARWREKPQYSGLRAVYN